MFLVQPYHNPGKGSSQLQWPSATCLIYKQLWHRTWPPPAQQCSTEQPAFLPGAVGMGSVLELLNIYWVFTLEP